MAIRPRGILGRDRGSPPLMLLLLALIGAAAGCGGSSHSGTSSPKGAGPTDATSSSVIAVDCTRQRAYVPLPNLNANLHGQVAVLDLKVDPDQRNPLLKIIDIGLTALPRSAAVDFKTGTVLVPVDDQVDTGTMLLIDESDDSLSTAPFPAGSRPAETAGVVVDSKKGTALVSMTDAPLGCTNGPGGCTGQATFDLRSSSFEPLSLNLTLFGVESFAANPSTGVSLATSDPITPDIFAIDVPGQETCLLEDINVDQLDADPDGIAVDPTTNIWVAANFQSPIANVINLTGATFNGTGTFNCTLDEGGVLPNSLNHDTGTNAAGMPGVAINSVTHQAFMTAQGGNQIALLSLPSARVTQLSASGIGSVNGAVPNDPNGNAFAPANFPYATVIDSCHNLGYVANSDYSFVAQIDLATFQKTPSAISTVLPAGSCAGVTTSFQCDNGSGVKFFPVSSTSSTAASSFESEVFQAHKAAKQRGLTRDHR